jgi:hypothetical protein
VTAPRNIVITATNDLYLPLVSGLLRSLRALRFSAPFDIGVLDVGLTENGKARLAAFGVKIVPAGVDIEYRGREEWERQLQGFRAMTARPFLPKYFPDYDVYMWIDADAWAQTPEAVDTMLAGAGGEDALFIVSEIDRDYKPYFLSSQPWEYHLKWYRANFPPEIFTAIFPRPMLIDGVFAMRASSLVWKEWAHVYTTCLQRAEKAGREQFMADQLSLNVAVYMKGFPLRIMPAEFGWLTLYSIPMFDEEKKLFVRPTPPRTPISIMHLTHEKKLRSFDIQTTTGGTITRTLLNEEK